MKPLLVFVCCLSLLMSAGCHEDPYLSVSPTSLSFGQDGGSQIVQVSANYAWTASISGSGFTVSPKSGEGSGSVTITASAVTSPDEVSGSVSFLSEGLTASVAFKQDAKSVIQVGSVAKIPAEGGTTTVDIRHNTEFSVEVEKDAQSWITFIQTKALKSGKLEFQLKANENYEDRTGEVTIKDKAGKVEPITLIFNQEAKKWVAVTGLGLSSMSIAIQVGQTFTLETTVTPEDASDKSVVWASSDTSIAKVDENGVVTGVAEGTATITAKAGDITAFCLVTVTLSSISGGHEGTGEEKWN